MLRCAQSWSSQGEAAAPGPSRRGARPPARRLLFKVRAAAALLTALWLGAGGPLAQPAAAQGWDDPGFFDDEAEPEGPWSAVRTHIERSLFPRLSLQGAFHAREGDVPDDLVVGTGRLDLEYRTALGRHGRVLLRPRLVYDSAGRSHGFEPTLDERPLRRRIFDVDTAEASAILGDLELIVGKRTYPWGRADFFNPTRFLDARDLTEAPRPHLLGVASAELRWTRGPLTLSALGASFTPARLPLEGSRWFPISERQLGVDPTLFPIRRELPARTPANLQGALRAALLLEQVDLALTAFEGFQTLPQVDIDLSDFVLGRDYPTAVLLYPRYRAIGLDASTTVAGLVLHAEAAHRFYDRVDGSSFLRVVGGVSRRFPRLVRNHDVTVAIEYAESVVTREGEPDGTRRMTDASRHLRRAAAAGVHYRVSDRLDGRLGALGDLTDRYGILVQAMLRAVVHSGIELELGGEAFLGSRREIGSLGRYRDDARLTLGIAFTPW